MKIIFTSNNLFSTINFRGGGLAKLKSKGHKVVLIAPPEKNKTDYHFLPINLSARGINLFKDLKLIFDLYHIYKNENPDIIFHYTIKPNIYGTIAAWLAGVPSIAVTTGLGYTFIQENWISKTARILYWFAFHFPKEVWFLNYDDMHTFINYKLIKPKKAVMLKGEGVNIEYFSPKFKNILQGTITPPTLLITQPSILNRQPVFIFLLIARMLWDKGIGEFVQATEIVSKKFPNIKFCLLGAVDVDNPSAITKKQMNEWVNIGFIDYLGTTDDVRPYITMADCIVLPSYYREGIPRTLLEAAAMEKPIITTNSIGCKEVVDNGINGFLCAPKNAQDLAIKMEKMITLTENERIEMGKRGREKVIKEFDEKLVIQKYLETIERIGIGRK